MIASIANGGGLERGDWERSGVRGGGRLHLSPGRRLSRYDGELAGEWRENGATQMRGIVTGIRETDGSAMDGWMD